MRARADFLAAAALAITPLPAAPVVGVAWNGSAAHLGRVTPAARKDALFKRVGRR